MYCRSSRLRNGSADLRIVLVVDQHARQRVAVEFDDPTAARLRSHDHVGRDRLRQGLVEGQGRLRIEGPNLRDQRAELFAADRQQPRQRHPVAFADQIEMLQAAGCIVASSRPRSCNCNARHSASERAKTPAGSKCCNALQRRLDPFDRTAQELGQRRQIARQIAGVVEHVDQVQADDPVDRIVDVDGELAAQMRLQRRALRQRFGDAGRRDRRSCPRARMSRPCRGSAKLRAYRRGRRYRRDCHGNRGRGRFPPTTPERRSPPPRRPRAIRRAAQGRPRRRSPPRCRPGDRPRPRLRAAGSARAVPRRRRQARGWTAAAA